MDSILINILLLIVGLFVGAAVLFGLKKKIFAGKYAEIEKLKTDLIEKSESELESRKKKLSVDIKEELANWKNEYNRKQSHKANKLNETERRLILKEENLDKKIDQIELNDLLLLLQLLFLQGCSQQCSDLYHQGSL